MVERGKGGIITREQGIREEDKRFGKRARGTRGIKGYKMGVGDMGGGQGIQECSGSMFPLLLIKSSLLLLPNES